MSSTLHASHVTVPPTTLRRTISARLLYYFDESILYEDHKDREFIKLIAFELGARTAFSRCYIKLNCKDAKIDLKNSNNCMSAFLPYYPV